MREAGVSARLADDFQASVPEQDGCFRYAVTDDNGTVLFAVCSSHRAAVSRSSGYRAAEKPSSTFRNQRRPRDPGPGPGGQFGPRQHPPRVPSAARIHRSSGARIMHPAASAARPWKSRKRPVAAPRSRSGFGQRRRALPRCRTVNKSNKLTLFCQYTVRKSG